MKARSTLLILALSAAVSLSVAPAASAQPKVEVGGSLASVVVGLDDDDDATVVGIPSASFGLLNPGVFGSFFLGDKAAFEPQIGLIWVSSGGESEHVLSLGAQFDFFFKDTTSTSPYAFAGGGITEFSDSSESAKSVAVGGGLRIPAGDRLVFRLDGRYIHFTDDGGNALAFGLSIGGVLK